jgi:acyl-CoA synthetase (AMP-forming)/AMP-acid ligase II
MLMVSSIQATSVTAIARPNYGILSIGRKNLSKLVASKLHHQNSKQSCSVIQTLLTPVSLGYQLAITRARHHRRTWFGDQRSDPSKLTEEAAKNYVGEKLSKYKRLEGVVKFVDAIPKNASGKILKRVLREHAKKELGLSSKL